MKKGSINKDFEAYVPEFRETLRKSGLKKSAQRELVLRLLFESDAHLNAEQVMELLKQKYGIRVGIATVYRVLALLEEIGIVSSIQLGSGDTKYYELNLMKEHHDHMICQKCGKVVEFYDERIEKLQEKIANEHDFSLREHTMILYGICGECRKAEEKG
ncbi:Fur family transcriptional regulator [Hydrogenimonas sp.]